MKIYWFLILISFFSSSSLLSQTSYKGFVDKNPYEMFIDIESNSFATATFVDTDKDEPFSIYGQIENKTLTFIEKDQFENVIFKIEFQDFDIKQKKVNGIWQNYETNEQYKIDFSHIFDLEVDQSNSLVNRDIIQSVTTNNHYFKLQIVNDSITSNLYVSAVKIFEKKTDKLIQKLDVKCQFMGLYGFNINDFNFDDELDFSIFEGSYSGANTTSLYFLYNKKTNTYFESGIYGTNLEFDSKSKRIIEYNQCCAGRKRIEITYKLRNNKMILVKKKCFVWDEEAQEIIEKKWKECE